MVPYPLTRGKRAKSCLPRDQPGASDVPLILQPPRPPALRLSPRAERAGHGFLPSTETASLNYWNVGHASPWRKVTRLFQLHFPFQSGSPRNGRAESSPPSDAAQASTVALMTRSWNLCWWNGSLLPVGMWPYHPERKKGKNNTWTETSINYTPFHCIVISDVNEILSFIFP